MNARARREAMQRMDAGDFAGARAVVFGSLQATRVACAPFSNSHEVRAECDSLEGLASSLNDRVQDKMNRKRLAYQAWARVRGKQS
jgi:hypothetical protein